MPEGAKIGILYFESSQPATSQAVKQKSSGTRSLIFPQFVDTFKYPIFAVLLFNVLIYYVGYSKNPGQIRQSYGRNYCFGIGGVCNNACF